MPVGRCKFVFWKNMLINIFTLLYKLIEPCPLTFSYLSAAFLIIGCFYLQFMISSFFFFKKYISSKGAEFQSRCWIAYMWKFIKDLQKWVVNFALCGGFFFVVQVYILYLNTLKFNLNGFDKISSLRSFLSLSSWEN